MNSAIGETLSSVNERHGPFRSKSVRHGEPDNGYSCNRSRDRKHRTAIGNPPTPFHFANQTLQWRNPTNANRARLRQPELIILEDPMLGLDMAGQQELDDLLKSLIRQGTRLLLITHDAEIPSWVTHRVQLNRDAVATLGSVSPAVWKRNLPPSPATPQRGFAPLTGTEMSRPPIIELHHVNVSLGGKPILQDISWTVREGERLSLTGPNGSGKTTLLSL